MALVKKRDRRGAFTAASDEQARWNVASLKREPPQPGATAEALDVGARIRSLRKQQGWTLDAAAERFEIARSTLAKVETGQMSPTIGLLQKIAHGLKIDIVALLKVDASPTITGRRTMTHAGQGERHETNEHVHELLCAGLANKRMLPFHSRIKARKDKELPAWYRHDAEEFVFVLDGHVVLHSEFYAPTRLAKGDAVYLDGRMGHCLVADGDEDANVLFVISE